MRFPGQYYDAESGLHQNWYRSYDPALGRYTSSDPIGLAGGLNTYTYASSQPTHYSDPLGLATTEEITTALQVIRDHMPERYPEWPKSVTPIVNLHNWANMSLQGYTDIEGNIQINANLYGDFNTTVNEFVITEFLQTIAHEWQHVQQSAFEKILTHGELHDQIDHNAEIIANNVLKDYVSRLKTIKNGPM